MEMIIVSENNELSEPIIQSIDACLAENRIRKMELYSMTPYSIQDIADLNTERAYFIFIDIRKIANEVEYCQMVMKKFLYGYFGIITDSANGVVKLLNRFENIYGCINAADECWEQELLFLLQKYEAKWVRMCDALVVYEAGVYSIIPFEEIDYIETIKATHYCSIHHKNGKNQVRGKVKNLITQLDERFEIVRSSTIVNIQNIARVDSKNKEIVFRDRKSCYYSERSFQKIYIKFQRNYTICN